MREVAREPQKTNVRAILQEMSVLKIVCAAQQSLSRLGFLAGKRVYPDRMGFGVET
jgi:hypothetical protein